MRHLHFYRKVGDWKGSWALKMCRCGAHKLYDLWGFQHEHTEDQMLEIISRLREGAK